MMAAAERTAPAPASDNGQEAAAGADARGASEPTPQAAEQRPQSFETDAFFGEADGPIRAALTSGSIASIEKGRGGRSLAFRVTLDNGQKGYFKPEQTFSAANWFGEVAAYHLDRLLGLQRVPAVVSRVFPWKALEPVAGTDPRKSEVIARDGKVVGAFVAWVTGGLRPMVQALGWERWVRVEHFTTSAVSPFQRPILWKRQVALARRVGTDWRSPEERAELRRARPEPDRADRPAELSDLIVFDYLTRNLDRWGGGNANVLVRGEGGPLVFLDNGAGFEPGNWRPDLADARLYVLQRFRRRTIEAVRALDLARFEARLAAETVTPVLPKTQFHALRARREALLAWVSELEAQHGEAIWAWE
jgi:hypothetical protein